MEPEDVVQRQVEAFNAHDVEAFIATYAQDAVAPWVVDYEIVENDAGSTPALAVYEVEGSLIQRSTIVRGPTKARA